MILLESGDGAPKLEQNVLLERIMTKKAPGEIFQWP